MNDHWIWFLLTMASIGWYGFLIFYVGYFGARDILTMLKDLREEALNPPPEERKM